MNTCHLIHTHIQHLYTIYSNTDVSAFHCQLRSQSNLNSFLCRGICNNYTSCGIPHYSCFSPLLSASPCIGLLMDFYLLMYERDRETLIFTSLQGFKAEWIRSSSIKHVTTQTTTPCSLSLFLYLCHAHYQIYSLGVFY